MENVGNLRCWIIDDCLARGEGDGGGDSSLHEHRCLPAAKWRGDERLPVVSLAFTLCGETNFLTLLRSPFLQASNNSLPASFSE